jgi:hypothetical protein
LESTASPDQYLNFRTPIAHKLAHWSGFSESSSHAVQSFTVIRCAICGCSRLDAQSNGCARCGGAPAVRWEQVHIDEETKAKLLAHADELKGFGITLEQEQPLTKDAALTIAVVALVLQVVDSLRSGVLHDLVWYLRDLDIPEEQILRLRLDEPENISKVLSEPPNRGKPKSAARKKPAVKRKRSKK